MVYARRSFLKLSAALSAGSAFPFLRAQSASPNEKVNIAFIGIGHQARNDFMMFNYYHDLMNVVAFCDTQMGAPHTQEVLKAYPSVPRYQDFRKMFDQHARELDAVCIATPDFAHFPATMLAMSLGKAVYCEKPLCNTFHEVDLMIKAAARHKVVTQMGNQGHSGANYWQMKTLVANGFIKDVTHIDAFMCSNRRWFKWNGTVKEMPGEEPLPPEMAWDVWLSQRPFRPFNHDFIYGQWRCFYEYGTGALGDWGAHIFDAAHEFLRLGLPSRIETLHNEGRTDVVYPMNSTTRFVFPARGKDLPELTLDWWEGMKHFPAPVQNLTKKYVRGVHGSEMFLKDGRVFARSSHGSASQLISGANERDPQITKIMRDYPKDKSNHYLNFLKAVKGEEPANSPFSVAGPLSQVLTLGALAQRLAEPVLAFDVQAGRITNSERANALLKGPPMRKEWEEFARL